MPVVKAFGKPILVREAAKEGSVAAVHDTAIFRRLGNQFGHNIFKSSRI
jgi:hypothetical protein